MSANNVDPDQMSHYVKSALGLHCLPMTLFDMFPGKNELNHPQYPLLSGALLGNPNYNMMYMNKVFAS